MRYFIFALAVPLIFFSFSCQTSSQFKDEAALKRIVDEQTWGRKNRANKAVKIYTETGDLYYKNRNYDRALFFYNKALIKLKYLKKLKHPVAAEIYTKIGDCYLKLNDKKSASEFYSKALAILRKFYGNSDPRTKSVLQKMENLSS